MTIPGTFHLDRRAHKIAAEIAAAGDEDQLLSTSETSEILDVSTAWLDIGRTKGYGPPYVVLGPRRVRYRRGCLREWCLSRTHRSTAEYDHHVTNSARKVGDKLVDGKVVRATG